MRNNIFGNQGVADCPECPDCPVLPAPSHPFLLQDVFDDLTLAIDLGSAVALDDGVHAFGPTIALGSTTVTNATRHHRYKTAPAVAEYGQWDSRALLPTARRQHRAARINGTQCYIHGGTASGSNGTALYRYDSTANTITTLASSSIARISHSLVVLGSGKLLAVGGHTAIASADIYDPATNSWAATDAYPIPIAYAPAVALPDGRALVIGGLTTADAAATVSYYYDETAAPGSKWSAAPHIGNYRGGAGIVGNLVYARNNWDIHVLDLANTAAGFVLLGKVPSRVYQAELTCCVPNPPRLITIGGWANVSGGLYANRASAVHLTPMTEYTL